MWEAIAKILTNANALLVLIFFLLFAILLIILAKTGLVQIRTSVFKWVEDIIRKLVVIREMYK